MARRVPLHDVQTVIETVEQDGGVILTDFSNMTDVEKVNSDVAPFIAAIKAEVSRPVCLRANQSFCHLITRRLT